MNINQPLVSIITPAYNHEKYVEQAIKSAINQTYRNIELIIIDDGSTDKTSDIIMDFISKSAISRIIFESQENRGLSKTLNKAVRMANGEFIAILFSDGIYLPNRIEECVNVLSRAKLNVCAVYSDGFIIDENGTKVGRFTDKYIKPTGKNTYKELLLGNWIAALSVLYRKSSLIECGLFDENLKVEDYDMLLRLAQKYKFEYIPEPLFLYRCHELNYSSDQLKIKEQHEIIIKKHADLKLYNEFMLAYNNRNFISLVRGFNFLNVELMFRSIIRAVQNKFVLVNVGYFELLYIIIIASLNLFKERLSARFMWMRGVKTGRCVQVGGKVCIKGNSKNIFIGDFVKFRGDVRFITEQSRNRELIQIGNNTVIDNNVTLFTHGGKLIIGENSFIGPEVHIQATGGVSIGNNTMIAAKTSIFASNHTTTRKDIPYKDQKEKFMGVRIGNNCWIGTSVVILDGADIGDNCIIGANCVLKGQYPKNSKIVAKEVVGKPIFSEI